MDEKELDQNADFDLDSILDEFHDPEEQVPESEADPDIAQALSDLKPAGASAFAEAAAEEEGAPEDALPEDSPETDFPSDDPEDALTAEEPEDALISEDPDLSEIDLDDVDLSDLEAADALEAEQSAVAEEADAPDGEEVLEADTPAEDTLRMNPQEAPREPAPPLHYDPQAKLRELKHQLVSGPEKRYYALSELGVGKLQVAVAINIVLVLLCAVGAVLFAAGRVPETRLRFMIFSQVLAMLISGLLGLNQILDGFAELGKGHFTINTMLGVTFLACIADAVFSLKDLRVPCCCAFCLEMAFALAARCQKRNTEMGQMDTLRKASRLHSMVKVPDYYQGQGGLLRSEGKLEDFTDHYQKSSGPQKLQSFYAFFSFLLCIGIAVLAGVLHGVSMAVQIFATSLLAAVPASFFIALTRPAAILERRLHMVGAVLCGWSGVKGLCGKSAFPIFEKDLFPQGSTKLNGIKFYSDRDPDMIVSYTSSLILEAGSGLIPIFEQLMNSRGVVPNPVHNFRLYEGGGIGGEVCGETVLLGSTEFLQNMGVDIPEGSMVSQAVYAAIDGELTAVVAVSFAKMRSAAAGMVTLCGYRKLTPIFLGGDFVLSEDFIRSKFEIHTRRLLFPAAEERMALSAKLPDPEAPGLAITTRPDLISFAYTVTGARALRTSCRTGMLIHLIGGILGLLTMAILAITGSTELLTPVNILLYQLIWMVPGFLVTEWTRHV